LRCVTIKLAILIPNYKRPYSLKRCLDSCSAQNVDKDIFVVDDCSPLDGGLDKVYDEIEEKPDHYLLRREENGGYTKAVNTGLKEILKRDIYEYVFLMNNDAYFIRNDGLKLLIDAFDDPLSVGITMQRDGLPCWDSEWPRKIGEKKLFRPDLHPYVARHELMKDSPCAWYEAWVGFWGTMIKTELFWKYGLLEEKFIVLGQDVDWCHRIRLYGWMVKVVNDYIMVHDHKTHQDIKPPDNDILNRDGGLWRRIWNPWRNIKRK